ncbi:MAG: bifunctional nuclease family protein [Candidatus Rokuibacteriota bacterium]|nr:MAG: bifunctional nuclease family protein [Candidatus Rokubacteria bacterium]
MTTSSRIGGIALLTLLVAAAPERAQLAPRGGDVAPRAIGPQEAEVVAVVMDARTETPAVVLEGKRDHRRLAMAIGAAEATGIAVPLHGITPPRPLTHDLFLTLFGRLQVSLTRVVITDLRDDIYYATVHLAGAGGELTLDSRPSDAIALAIRAHVPVLVEDRVFDKGGVDGAAPRRPHI